MTKNHNNSKSLTFQLMENYTEKGKLNTLYGYFNKETLMNPNKTFLDFNATRKSSLPKESFSNRKLTNSSSVPKNIEHLITSIKQNNESSLLRNYNMFHVGYNESNKKEELKFIVNSSDKKTLSNYFKHKTKSNETIVNYESDQLYTSAYEALANIKINKFIHQAIETSNIKKQTEKYIEVYNKALTNHNKLVLMPQIKSKVLQVKVDEDDYKIKKSIFDEINEEKQIHKKIAEKDKLKEKEKKKKEVVLLPTKTRKEMIYQNMNINISLIQSSVERPVCRVNSAGIVYKHFFILFGGLQTKKLNDLWICNLDLEGKYRLIVYKEHVEALDKIRKLSDLNKILGKRGIAENPKPWRSARKSTKVTTKEQRETIVIKNEPEDFYANLTKENEKALQKYREGKAKLFFTKLDEITDDKDQVLSGKRMVWKQIKNFETKIPEERCGHSMCLYEDKIYIYGGKTNGQTETISLMIFNLNTLQFSIPQRNYCMVEVKKRFYHTAVSFKNYMIVYGGIEATPKQEKENILSDLVFFNYLTGVWDKVIYTGHQLTQVYGHSCAVVISEDKLQSKSYDLYYYYNEASSKIMNTMKNEGIYFYGGRDEQGNSSSYVKILKIFKKPCEIVNQEINGKPPRPRYFASFSFYSKMNVCILYGGRNNDEFFKDIFLLDTIVLCWIKVLFTNEQRIYRLLRCGHLSYIYENSLFIFGGENDKTYESSDVLCFDLEFENTIKYSNPRMTLRHGYTSLVNVKKK